MTIKVRRLSTAVTSLTLLACLTLPALALDPIPKGSKEKERHVFRDVQMGLSHPAPGGQSVPGTDTPKPLFPWLPPPADPAARPPGQR